MGEAVRKLIGGTYGGSESQYLVFAESEDGNFEIAIRPLVNINAGNSEVGFRIRAVPKTFDDVASGAFVSEEGTEIMQAFPNFPWTKCDSVRASTVAGVPVQFGRDTIDKFREWLVSSAYPSQIIESLKESLAPVALIDEADFAEWLLERYLEPVSAIEAEISEAQSEAEANAEVGGDGVVVSLEAWKNKADGDDD